MTSGVRETKRLEQILIDRFGWAENYMPPGDGGIDPKRIEAFIRIRETLQPRCAEYQAVLAGIKNLELLETDHEGHPENPGSTGLQGLKSVFRSGPEMLEYTKTRNRALLDSGMGLGEYLYLYLGSYGEQLSAEAVSTFSKMEEAYISDRARTEYAQILNNQIAALESSPSPASLADLTETLRAEIRSLEDGSHPAPWPHGPIGKTREALAPFRQQLDALYCSGIARIELLQKNRGFHFDG